MLVTRATLACMPELGYRLLNVFGIDADPFSGNPLCVFEDGRGLTDAQMQALALQFNLSETTFILPSERAHARVRIFTPSFEMPFAGHPTLGSAHVVSALQGQPTRVQLELGVGPIAVEADRERKHWTLAAPSARTRPAAASPSELASMLGIAPEDIGAPVLWVDAGNEQLLVPMQTLAALERCAPTLDGLRKYGSVNPERCLVYAFCQLGGDKVSARLFFNKATSVIEDPATGSACANLGGYLLAQAAPLPLVREIDQGRAVGRPSRLTLRIDADRNIFVSGRVFELGRGELAWPG
jgi:PhzF family phenazine biosynthesis protein